MPASTIRRIVAAVGAVGFAALAQALHDYPASGSTPTPIWSFVDARLGLLPAEDARFAEAAFRLWLRNPSREARVAVARKDHRLVAVAGLGMFIPGTPAHSDARYYAVKYGLREHLGAGDFGDGYAFLYQKQSYEFALAFNLVVLQAVGERTDGQV